MAATAISAERIVPITRAGLLAAGVPERYWKASLKVIPAAPYKDKLLHFLRDIHLQVTNGRGLLLHGDFESGKTSAAVALLKEVLRRGGSAYFLKVRDILRAIYDQEETLDGTDLIRNVIKSVDVLVLDDLGAEGFDPKKNGGAELEGVVRDRYDRRKTLIVTSNYEPQGLPDYYTKAFVNILRRTITVVHLDTNCWKGK